MNETTIRSGLSFTATVIVVSAISFIMVLTLLGNTLVLFVLYRQRKKPTVQVSNMLLANLSVVDMLIGTLLIPFAIAVALNEKEILLNDSICQLNGFMNILVGSASIWTMAVISVDRYSTFLYRA